MSDCPEIPERNPSLSAEEMAVVARLSDAELEAIDHTILANCSHRWLKVARVVAWTDDALRDSHPGLSSVFYAQRLIHLATQGRLDSQGNLEHMRFSEVRLVAESPAADIPLIPLSEARTE